MNRANLFYYFKSEYCNKITDQHPPECSFDNQKNNKMGKSVNCHKADCTRHAKHEEPVRFRLNLTGSSCFYLVYFIGKSDATLLWQLQKRDMHQRWKQSMQVLDTVKLSHDEADHAGPHLAIICD